MTTATQPAPHRSAPAPVLSALTRRVRPAITGAAFGVVAGILLSSGGVDPAAAVAASTGFGLAAGLLVPAGEADAGDAKDRDPGAGR